MKTRALEGLTCLDQTRKRKNKVAAVAAIKEDHMENNKALGIAIAVGLSLALIFTIVSIAKPKGASATGAATTAMSTDGFSSYEEMMAAHHPNQASGESTGVGGCGGEPQQGHEGATGGTGEMSVYGITYDTAGYNQLLDAAKNTKLTAEQTKLIVGLDAQIPCCGFTTLQESGNCECGHHVALFGLAKLLATKNYTRDQIQSEMNKWKEVFYPGGGSGNTGGC